MATTSLHFPELTHARRTVLDKATHASCSHLPSGRQMRAPLSRNDLSIKRPHFSVKSLQAEPVTVEYQVPEISSKSIRLALKEWAVICAALGRGDQIVIFRKGGIREPYFRPKAHQFLLFPTAIHADQSLLREGASNEDINWEPDKAAELPLKYAAQVTGAWSTADSSVVHKLAAHHIWDPAALLHNRLKWRQKQPITLLELNCRTLTEPLLLPANEAYWGCFSWLCLDQEIASKAVWESARPALLEAEFCNRQSDVRKQLALCEGVVDLM